MVKIEDIKDVMMQFIRIGLCFVGSTKILRCLPFIQRDIAFACCPSCAEIPHPVYV